MYGVTILHTVFLVLRLNHCVLSCCSYKDFLISSWSISKNSNWNITKLQRLVNTKEPFIMLSHHLDKLIVFFWANYFNLEVTKTRWKYFTCDYGDL